MGCQFSTLDSSGRRRVSQAAHQSTSIRASCDMVDFLGAKSLFFEKILKNCEKITIPKCLMPTVCLGENAFPLIAYSLQDIEASDVKLPIISSSLYGQGRVVVFSQLSFISKEILDQNDNLRLMKNVLKWALNGRSRTLNIPAIGFSDETVKSIMKTLDPLEYNIKKGSISDDFINTQLLLISSSAEFKSEKEIENVANFVHSGGSVVVFYENSEEMNVLDMTINKLLIKFNLAFSFLCLNNNDSPPETQQVQSVFSYVKDLNFLPLITDYKALLQKDEMLDSVSLDGVVSNLRYYILVCDGEEFCEKIVDLLNASCEYLERTNYIKDDKMCNETPQGIVTVLLVQLLLKLPVNMIKESPNLERFPGKTGDVKLSNFEIDFDLNSELWVSTGLWLPPGVVGTIEADEPLPSVTIHIGSHSDVLYTKPQPWSRWPNIATVAQMTTKSIDIASPFGGITYIILNDTQKEIHSKIRFHNFCNFPVADASDKSRWEQTKNIDVPWGEIVSKNVIFTLPTERIKKIESILPIIFEKFDFVADEISQFMSYQLVGPYRYVFDIEEYDGMRDGYPIAIPMREIDNILYSFDKPTKELFAAISSMALVSMKEGFEHELENALADIAALDVMKKLFKNENVREYCVNDTYTFKVLWEIDEKSGGEIIKNVLKNITLDETEGKEAQNKLIFTKKLSELTKSRVYIP